MGFRNQDTNGIATGDEPETIYMVTSGTHYNGGCCFDCTPFFPCLPHPLSPSLPLWLAVTLKHTHYRRQRGGRSLPEYYKQSHLRQWPYGNRQLWQRYPANHEFCIQMMGFVFKARSFVLKTRNCVFMNEEFCITYDEFCRLRCQRPACPGRYNDKNDGFCIKNDGFCIEMQSCTSDPSHHVIYRDCTDRMRVNSSFYINYI